MSDTPFDDLGLGATPLAIADPLLPGRWAPAVCVPGRASEPADETVLLGLDLRSSPQEALRQARKRALMLEEP